MKSNLVVFGIAGLSALLLSSFVQKANDDDKQKPKTERHVRIVKIKDGKKAEIDTVLTGTDTFIWKGDTINPPKHFRGGIGEAGKIRGPRPGGDMDIFITRRHKGAPDTPQTWMFRPRHEMDLFKGENDSANRRIVIRKFERRGGPEHSGMWRNQGRLPGPPAPPAPPVNHSMRISHPENVIDLNDPGIVSYKKKDIGGGREKIEIVRKKGSEKQVDVLNFRFNRGDFMVHGMPGMPEGLDFGMDMKHDSLGVEPADNGKEIDIKVEQKKK